ncbi:hypothetical protein B1218_37440, partial [Pseudomonas ogarae]
MEADGGEGGGETVDRGSSERRSTRWATGAAPERGQGLVDEGGTGVDPAVVSEGNARVNRLRQGGGKRLAEGLEGVGQDKKTRPSVAGERDRATT